MDIRPLRKAAPRHDPFRNDAATLIDTLGTGRAATLNEGLAPLIARGLIGADLRPKPGCDPLLAFYAAPIWQRLEDAATRQT